MDRIILVQIGPPKEPSIKEIRIFLWEFLKSPYVVDGINPLLWRIILLFFILPKRPKQLKIAYEWMINKYGFQPLIEHTKNFTEKVNEMSKDIDVRSLFIFHKESFQDAFDNLTDDTKLHIIPLFPQQSKATTDLCINVVQKYIKKHSFSNSIKFHSTFPAYDEFVDAAVKQIDENLNDNCDILLLSFHGYPIRRTISGDDPYLDQCNKTFSDMIKKITKIDQSKILLSFQSRYGKEEWTKPYTDILCQELIKRGNKKIAIYCPSFLVDCLETYHEIDHDLKTRIEQIGGKIQYINCLNANDHWAQSFSNAVNFS